LWRQVGAVNQVLQVLAEAAEAWVTAHHAPAAQVLLGAVAQAAPVRTNTFLAAALKFLQRAATVRAGTGQAWTFHTQSATQVSLLDAHHVTVVLLFGLI
jgi:hypothetical protein